MSENFHKLNDDELDVITGGEKVFLYNKVIVNNEVGYDIVALDDNSLMPQSVGFVKKSDFQKYKKVHEKEGIFVNASPGAVFPVNIDALSIQHLMEKRR